MWLKAVGAALVIGSSGLAGHLVARSFARRPLELLHLEGALLALETEVLCGTRPLAEGFERIARQAGPPADRLFSSAARLLREGEGMGAGGAFTRALAAVAEESALRDEDLELLGELAFSFRAPDRRQQADRIRRVRGELAAARHRAEGERAGQIRLWNYLGVAWGLVLTLLLL